MNPEDEVPVESELSELAITPATDEKVAPSVVPPGGTFSSYGRLQEEEKFSLVRDAVQNSKNLDPSQEDFSDLKDKLMSDNVDIMLPALVRIRRLLSIENTPPIDQVVNCGMLPRLVSLVKHENNVAQFEAAWAVTNVASGTTEQTTIAVQNGAVAAFCDVLRSPTTEEVREQCVWGLGNIAGDSPAHRDFVHANGVAKDLVALVKSVKRTSFLRNIVWCISNLCRGKPKPTVAQILPFMEILPRLMFAPDTEIVTDTMWALSYISEIDQPSPTTPHPHQIILAGSGKKLISFLFDAPKNVLVPSLRTIGNLVTGDDQVTQAVLNIRTEKDQSVLDAFARLLQSDAQQSVMKESCWALSNITAGTPNQVKAVIDHPTVFGLVVNMATSSDPLVANEAVWCISNGLSGGTVDTLTVMADKYRVFEALAKSLMIPVKPMTISATISGLNTLLTRVPGDAFKGKIEEQGLLEVLEELQEHPDEKVYESSLSILENHFEAEEIEGGNPVPEQEHAPANFNFS